MSESTATTLIILGWLGCVLGILVSVFNGSFFTLLDLLQHI